MSRSRFPVGMMLCAAITLAPLPAWAYQTAQSSNVASTTKGLPQALRAALKHNPAVKGQLALIKRSEYATDAARAARFPSLSVSAQALDNETSQGVIRLEQPIWSFGRIDAAIDASESAQRVEQHGLLQVKRDLQTRTADAYLAVQAARFSCQVARENLEEHQRLYSHVQRRQQGQLASQADVGLAHARLLKAQSDLLRHQGALEAAQVELYALTQVRVDDNAPVQGPILTLPPQVQLRRLAMSGSADIRQARERVELAKAQMKQAATAQYPMLALTVEQSIASVSGGRSQDETTVGLQFQSRLDGMSLATGSQIRAASAAVNAARFELESVRNEVVRKLDSLLSQRELQSGLLASQQRSVEAAQQTMDSFLRRYNANRKSWVEVLNQQREVTGMRHALIDTEQQWMRHTLHIAAMTGVLDSYAGVSNEQ